eukprot:5737246-Pyramimonas_sp.AAC.1
MDMDALGAWDRPPNAASFWCGAASEFSVASLKIALAPWFVAADVDIIAPRINSEGPARRISFTLAGGNTVAPPRAQALHRALRQGREWRRFQ